MVEAPIALFVYNRPEHARRTLEALSRNDGAERSCLYIFADGLAQEADAMDRRNHREVRRLIRERPWCGRVEIIEADVNRGLKESICTGISRVLESYDRVIVLEDDIEISPGFLRYMNGALDLYADEDQVFQISGFMVKNWPWIQSTGFLRVSTSWGWGTWRRAWKHYRADAENLLIEVGRKGRTQFDLDGYSFHFEELERNVRGELNTWAVRWYASIFLLNGLCLYPRKTLVRNIGFDGSGVHCHNDKMRYHRRLRLARNVEPERRCISEDKAYLKAIQAHYRETLRVWTHTRVRDRLLRRLRWPLAR
ncbi:hypothetical protein [Elongatibacter sediminis]|uniref:Glycosyltransferase 2-like domain-containing protein n=1 Tax=Elongatibacter sediminis TaxID=3119006 RepID=A0AAW9R5K1_9GAMM